MTLEAAIAYAKQGPIPVTIYRLPSWPANVWGVSRRTPADMPKEAIIHTIERSATERGSLF